MTKVSITNIGPIAHGEIVLKPLTVFMGPTDTGKSYMAGAIHRILEGFEIAARNAGAMFDHPFARVEKPRTFRGTHLPHTHDFSLGIVALRQWLGDRNRKPSDLHESTVHDLPLVVQEDLERSVLLLLESIRGQVLDRFLHAYEDPGALISRWSGSEDSRVATHNYDPLLHLEVSIRDALQPPPRIDLAFTSLTNVNISSLDADSWSSGEASRASYSKFIFNLRAVVMDNLLAGLPLRSFYIPGSRAGIVRGLQILAAAFAHQLERASPGYADPQIFPDKTADFLNDLVSLDAVQGDQEGTSALADAILLIEREILHGQVLLEHSSGPPYPNMIFKPTDGPTVPDGHPISHPSAMLTELAPLVVFLKYLVQPGDILTLEEPEAHLHPAAQRQIARAIVRLVNAGVHVLITTNSEFFLGQVNNLIQLNHASPQFLKKHGFERSDGLKQDDVAAYQFRSDNELSGSTIEELTIDEENGIDDTYLGEVAWALYEETISQSLELNSINRQGPRAPDP